MIRRWLLIEHPGPWPVDALTTPDFSPDLRTTLTDAARAVGGRVVLVRRPGRRGRARETARRSWAVVLDAGVQWGHWAAPDDLRGAAAALRHPAPHHTADPILLVCAHGMHDTCCALRGRPVATALAEQWPEATWECSHVGGCRFAPNLVVLPSGVYYGYLDPAAAVGVVRRHLAGEVTSGFLRGVTRFPPVAQAALAAISRLHGAFGVDDAVVHAIEEREWRRWEVVLSVGGQHHERVVVVATERPRAHLTCRAAQDTAALQYEVVDQAVREAP